VLAPSASARNHVTSNIRYPTPTRHSTRSPWSSYQASGAPTAPTHSRGNGGPTAFDDSDLCSCDVMGAARAGRTGGWSVGGELTLGFIASPLPTIASCLSVMPRSAVSTLVIAPYGLLRRRGGRKRSFCMSSSLRQRAIAGHVSSRGSEEGVATKPQPWHAVLSVRVVVVLLALFCFMHLALWKVVYDFAMDTDHERLQNSARQAWGSLQRVREHLHHFGSEV
jgi:hypothetical protein